MSNVWAKGMESPNPSGKAAHGLTWQNYVNRAGLLLERYEADEIAELKNKINSGKRVPLSSFDCLIISNVGAALAGDGKERDRLLDRVWGKSVQRIGGENPGEPIKLSATNGMGLESLDSDTLLAIAELIRAAKEKQTMMTIEGSATPLSERDSNSDLT